MHEDGSGRNDRIRTMASAGRGASGDGSQTAMRVAVVYYETICGGTIYEETIYLRWDHREDDDM